MFTKSLIRQLGRITLAGMAVLAMAGTVQGDEASDALLAQGKKLFEETAGGVGCALCHGMNGAGDPNAGAPDVRGADEQMFRAAWGGAAPVMSFITLNNDEVEAVVAYLAYLDTL